jgi:hypothetical protein
MPVLFSPVNPRKLYFASNVLWQTTSGGQSWDRISPDLTRETWDIPASVGVYRTRPEAQPTQRGVIYTIAPSPLDEQVIWVGTDDGLIHRTADGGRTWADVTPPDLGPWWKVSLMDASPASVDAAYAAVNTFRLDDLRPHIYRTRDGGRTWTRITRGIPDGGAINVVRVDPATPGLLFAGSEQAVYVSFDDGERWQSLRLDMPATSIRDLVVKDDDLVVATHGRGFWILDDITPLRQLAAVTSSPASRLVTPRPAWRVRGNMNVDTPLPPDEPAGENPPDGATLHLWLPADVETVTLEVLDGAGGRVRRYSSDDPAEPPVEGRNTPDYWLRPHQPLPRTRGLHRFVWDLHHEPPAVPAFGYPIAAIAGRTPRTPLGSWARPGRYTVRLTAGGAVHEVPLEVRMDPRVKTPAGELTRLYELSRALDAAMRRAAAAVAAARAEGEPGRARAQDLQRAWGSLVQLYTQVEGADAPATTQLREAVAGAVAAVDRLAPRP